MPFNAQTFRIRALTAIVFVIIMLAGLLINEWSFLLLFTIIHFGCWLEYQKLTAAIDPAYKRINAIHKYTIPLHQITYWVMIALFAIAVLAEVFFSIKNTDYSILGLLYISLSWGLMMNLRTIYYAYFSWHIPLFLIASIWINDTMAYIVGSLLGKTPFSPISPKKTWEGTIGGALLAVATVTLLGHYVFGLPNYTPLIIISSIAAIVGTLGDLLESKLKRMANLKDSGSIMPGHGGFLDRFDSLLLATPFVWLYVHFFR